MEGTTSYISGPWDVVSCL